MTKTFKITADNVSHHLYSLSNLTRGRMLSIVKTQPAQRILSVSAFRFNSGSQKPTDTQQGKQKQTRSEQISVPSFASFLFFRLVVFTVSPSSSSCPLGQCPIPSLTSSKAGSKMSCEILAHCQTLNSSCPPFLPDKALYSAICHFLLVPLTCQSNSGAALDLNTL